MAKRSTTMQSAHNMGVKHEANELARQGWKVYADHIQQYPDPPIVNGRIPDIYATKNGWVRIVEIETSTDDDREQHTAFRRHAGQKNNVKFYGWIVNSLGRRTIQFY